MTAWSTATVGAVCSTYSGGTPSTARPEYYGGDIPWIASAELNQGRITSTKGRISKVGLERSAAKLVEPGTPLIALYGATAGVSAITCIGGAINQAVLAMVPRGVDAEFLYQWLRANRDEIIDRYTQGGQPNLSGAIVRSIEIPLPSISEQRRVARKLRDVDDLIATLERLIAKKQSIKQGMMQQLLTGKIRLPGFTAPWGELASFEELCTRSTGFWGERQWSVKAPNRVRVITAGDITPEGNLTGAATRFFSTPQVAKARCLRDDLVVTSSGNGLGKTAYIDEPGSLAASNFVRILRPRRGVSGMFLAQVMRTPAARAMLDSNTATSAYPNLLPGFFTEPWIPRPPLDEQMAIAATLRDADLQMTTLLQRVVKARAMKTGMLQQLLTGRTRLPAAVSS